ncbi:MAG: 30S ribosomal protein S16 [Planctomycetes bacterium]|nr:30S ribosomal protein S16 [Planctomycetota bacterium]
MGVRIRMKKMGRKNRPHFRMCVFDSRTKRDGAELEILGRYDPIEKDPAKGIAVNAERALYWLSVGALPTAICRDILRRRNIALPVAAPQPKPKKKDAVAKANPAPRKTVARKPAK